LNFILPKPWPPYVRHIGLSIRTLVKRYRYDAILTFAAIMYNITADTGVKLFQKIQGI